MNGIIQSLKDAPVMNLFVLVGFILVVIAAVGRIPPKWRIDVGGRVFSGVCGLGLLGSAAFIFLGLRETRSVPPRDMTPAQGGRTRAEGPAPTAPVAPEAAAAPAPAAVAQEEYKMARAPASSAPAREAPKTAKPAKGPAAHPSSAPKAAARDRGLPVPAPTPSPHLAARIVPEAMREVVLPPASQYGDWGCEETKTISSSLVLPEGAQFRSAVVDVVGVDNAKSFQKLEPTFDKATRTVKGAVEFRGLDRIFFNCPGGGHATVRLKVTAAIP